MASLNDLRAERLGKLERLRVAGRDPYPIATTRDVTLETLQTRFAVFAKRRKPLTIAGRVMAIRHQGALVFVDLDDGTGRLQTLLKQDVVGEKNFALFVAAVDRGDFVAATGSVGLTKRRERTLFVASWQLLVKTLRPLPDKWHGLTDTEERFRRRYLDSLMNETVKQRFITRSAIIASLREFLSDAPNP